MVLTRLDSIGFSFSSSFGFISSSFGFGFSPALVQLCWRRSCRFVSPSLLAAVLPLCPTVGVFHLICSSCRLVPPSAFAMDDPDRSLPALRPVERQGWRQQFFGVPVCGADGGADVTDGGGGADVPDGGDGGAIPGGGGDGGADVPDGGGADGGADGGGADGEAPNFVVRKSHSQPVVYRVLNKAEGTQWARVSYSGSQFGEDAQDVADKLKCAAADGYARHEVSYLKSTLLLDRHRRRGYTSTSKVQAELARRSHAEASGSLTPGEDGDDGADGKASKRSKR